MSGHNGSSKGWSLSQSIPREHVSPSSCGGFWMSTLGSKQVSSLMCQHGVQEDIGQILGYSRAEFKGDIFQGGKYNCTKP